jgi:hypothetical protein
VSDKKAYAQAAAAFGRALNATDWVSLPYAEAWYRDARAASGLSGRDARRREILFAVCCAEAYLFEWTWEGPLRHDVHAIPQYFDPGDRAGVRERWKDVTRRLHANKLLTKLPRSGDTQSEEWARMIGYRDGLVHGVASLPVTNVQPSTHRKPMPTPNEIEALSPGWAADVVAEQCRRLHEAEGTEPPPWLR